MPLIETKGAASAQGFGEFLQTGSAPVYIEQIFSTYLYTGNGSTQTITNNIDLSGKGGLVWCKIRNTSDAHALFDTARGFPNYLVSNATIAQNGYGAANTNDMQPTSSGFSMANTSSASNSWNSSGNTFASWTFRKQAKFFDVVTYTGNGSTQTISHNLSVAPAVVIIKKTSAVSNWYFMHTITSSNCKQMYLNTTAASSTSSYNSGNVFSAQPTSTSLFLGSEGDTNANGATFVAYLFASDAGGFGTAGTDNVISCGSYTTDGSNNATVNLGYEPQWVLYRRINTTGQWYIDDTMRGLYAAVSGTGGYGNDLFPNASSAESVGNGSISINATGFANIPTGNFVAGDTIIYIAIRRGPMKTPTSGTSVFTPALTTNDASIITAGFPVDQFIFGKRAVAFLGYTEDRLRGTGQTLRTNTTGAEASNGVTNTFDNNTGVIPNIYGSTTSMIAWMFQRAPSFFDVVCYTGTGSATTFNHNLGVVPELILVKKRASSAANWAVYSATAGSTKYLILNTTDIPQTDSAWWNNTSPTSSVFSVKNATETNASGSTYVAYLFATCTGVSKVGSYTGTTGTTKQIDCGFTSGARFVLIKNITTSGTDWYVYDSARGIVAGDDPYLLLNSSAAEVTNTDYVDTYSAGFEISSTAPTDINQTGSTFIFLAIA